MKTYFKKLSFILFTVFSFVVADAQQSGIDSTGLPGDNFDLQGALEMFKKASSPEDFEKLLNSMENNVNNLDLDGDGETDYIRVIDKTEKDAHAFVLQVAVSESESQDIAVVELEKTGNEYAIVQIIGDEEIYGEPVIAEPENSKEDNALVNGWNKDNANGPGGAYFNNEGSGIIVNVWFWPSVRFVFAPAYRPWISPWRWRHYPVWWQPWRPLAWHMWQPRRVVYHRNFVVVNTHRVVRAHSIYTPFRTSSVTVRSRNTRVVNNYRLTRTKTTVTGPRGRSATKTTTTVRGQKGKVKAKKTKIRRY